MKWLLQLLVNLTTATALLTLYPLQKLGAIPIKPIVAPTNAINISPPINLYNAIYKINTTHIYKNWNSIID